jgi:predicted phosphodiesterase
LRYAILGDIHGNLQALTAVLHELRRESIDTYVSVGDVVGYGADPKACIDILHDIKATVVAGNHDWAVVGKLDTSFFNVYAKAAVDWTASILGPKEKTWLAQLPLQVILNGEITVVHATLDAPERFEYIQSYFDAVRSLNVLETRVGFIGHSHIPVSFLVRDSLTLSTSSTLDLTDVVSALINIGSIGQPRDENPLAAYAIYDSTLLRYEIRRIGYDIEAAGDRIRQVGLPAILAERLRFGR